VKAKALIPPSEEDVKEAIQALKQMCYGNNATRQATIRVVSTGEIEMHDFRNACDLIRSGCGELFGDFCDVCYGHGTHKGETCWHCEGEGIDPSK
jgi:hypothetical protein